MDPDGIVLIDKPAHMTSFGVVARIRRVLTEQLQGKRAAGPDEFTSSHRTMRKTVGLSHKRLRAKVGHTGTLDPFATGLMILVTGKECKNAGTYAKLDKVYEATFKLGQTSSTGDPEGELTYVSDRVPTKEEVGEAIKKFTGEIKQRPPIFSAIKIDGVRAYKLARDGIELEIPERTINVYALDLINYDYPLLKVRAHVSSGTYIRSLGVDIGEHLAMGAYCTQLRRTSIGQWDIKDAKQLSDFGVN